MKSRLLKISFKPLKFHDNYMLIQFLKSFYIHSRFYLVFAVIVVLYLFGYFFDPFYLVAKATLVTFLFILFIDFYLLFLTGRNIISLTRELPEKFSNGDNNIVSLFIKNDHFFPVRAFIIDDIPPQFQIRNYTLTVDLLPRTEKKLEYRLKPTQRGEYEFGKVNTYIINRIGMFMRRYTFQDDPSIVPVYPSFLNIRKFEFLAVSNRLTEAGIKRIHRKGQFSEFDQIREYVKGDDSRTINWKTTAKRNKLMVNQFQDERSQQVYNIIDMGRVMKMPFDEMSLLDYAINSSLVLANIALQKHDKAGLVTFNTNIDAFIKAERRKNTMLRLLEVLYKQDTRFEESNFELLYITIRKKINHRSLIILYTNFESFSSLERQLAYLRRLAQSHLLLIIFFENTEIINLIQEEVRTVEEIYIRTIAQKFIHEKQLIVKELNKHGIYSILTRPGQLTVNLINKYLEFKDIGLI